MSSPSDLTDEQRALLGLALVERGLATAAARALACALAGVLLLGGCAAAADSTSRQHGTTVRPTLSLPQQLARERAALLPIVQAVAARFGADPHRWDEKGYDGMDMPCGMSDTGQSSPRQWMYDVMLEVPTRGRWPEPSRCWRT